VGRHPFKCVSCQIEESAGAVKQGSWKQVKCYPLSELVQDIWPNAIVARFHLPLAAVDLDGDHENEETS